MPDLWPSEFGTIGVTPPLVTLKEQADAISSKTQGRIVGQVQTSRHSEGFAHGFFLVAPLLDNYTYRLFVVVHNLQLYPLDIQADVINRTSHCDSPEDFLNQLREIFAAEQTKNVIKAILAQTDAVMA
jgi:hypothetical protein